MKLPFPAIGQSVERNVYALRETLFRIFEHLELPHYAAGGAWEYLQARYTEPGRYYHTLGHLVDMFNAAVLLDAELEPAEALAILYHDVIYEVGAKDNEERSAVVVEELSKQLIVDARYSHRPDDESCSHVPNSELVVIDTAAQIIRDTARYLDYELPMPAAHSLLVMDLDLSSFAKPYELFEMTNQLVREEVGIDHATHAAFLSRFLHRDFIYRTAEARKAWESIARDNIVRYAEAAEEGEHADEA